MPVGLEVLEKTAGRASIVNGEPALQELVDATILELPNRCNGEADLSLGFRLSRLGGVRAAAPTTEAPSPRRVRFRE